MDLASYTIYGRSLSATPEGVFLLGVAIFYGARVAKGLSFLDGVFFAFIGAVAMSQVPVFNAWVSKVTTQSWAGYGVGIGLAILGAILYFKGK